MPRDANEIYRQKLREKLEAAVAKAMPLALVGKFDAAEQTVREVDRDVYGWLAMARMYIAAIAALGGEKASHSDRVTVMAMFDRAVAHRELAYPMHHTKEESDRYSIGQSQDRSKVVQEIGFVPNIGQRLVTTRTPCLRYHDDTKYDTKHNAHHNSCDYC